MAHWHEKVIWKTYSSSVSTYIKIDTTYLKNPDNHVIIE